MTTTRVDVRQLIIEIMEDREAQELTEAEALASAKTEMRRRKDSLKDDFFEQFIESAVDTVWSGAWQRRKKAIDESIKERSRGRGVRDTQEENAPDAAPVNDEGDGGDHGNLDAQRPFVSPLAPNEAGQGGDHGALDAHSQDVSPAADEEDGGDRFQSVTQAPSVAPALTPKQIQAQRWLEEDRREEQKPILSIWDYPIYPGKGVGRTRLGDANFGIVRKAARRLAVTQMAFGKWRYFLEEVVGDKAKIPGSGGPDDTQVREAWSTAALEALYISSGCPPIQLGEAIIEEAEG